MSHGVLCALTLGPQVVRLFGKVLQTSEKSFARGSKLPGVGFEMLLPTLLPACPLLPDYQSRGPYYQAFPHGRFRLEQHVLENSLGQILY